MTDDEIQEMAAQLEAAARVEDARLLIVQHGGGPDESHVVANRSGYLRFAALFLRAAVSPHREDRANVLDLDDNGLIDEDADIFFSWFERRENDWQIPQQKPVTKTASDYFTLFGCTLFCFVMALIFCLGAVTLFGLIAR